MSNGLRRTSLLLLLLAALPVLGGALGRLAGPSLSRTHYIVQVAERVWAQEQDAQSGEEDLQVRAFRISGRQADLLYTQAREVRDSFRVGGMLFGIWCGVVLGLSILSILRERAATEYVADHAHCLACGRCYLSCPIEHKRLNHLPGARARQEEARNRPMQSQRKTALALTVILGIFVLSVAGVLTTLYGQELRAGILTSPALEELKTQLLDNPKDQTIKERIRQEDQELRRQYFQNRQRFTWAGYLLLLGLVGWVASAGWFFSLAPARTPSALDPVAPPPCIGEELARQRRWAVTTILLVGAAPFVMLALLALYGAPKLPPLEGGKPAETIAEAPLQPQATPQPPESTPPPAPEATPAPTSAPTPAPSEESPYKQNWPCLRGPGNIGIAQEGTWPTTWTVATKPDETDRNVAWKVELPLQAKSSPVVWGNRIFITGGDATEQRVACIERSSGAVLWNALLNPPKSETEEHDVFEDTGFASSTPATDGERVYALYATGVLAAFDFAGNQVWARDFGFPKSMYGFASSLIVHDGVLILQYDQGDAPEDELSKVYGLDPATGLDRWVTPRPVGSSWASPAIVATPERTALITSSLPWAIAYDPANGTELWRAEVLDGDVAPSPAFGGGLVYVTNDGAQLTAIRPDGSGDVTKTHVAWTGDEGMPDISSPLCDGKRVLQVAAGGYLTCWSVADGKLLWEEYLPTNASSSPILAGGLVYLASEDGEVFVIELGDAYKLIDKGFVGEAMYATPAYVDSQIIIRGEKHLICIEEAR